MTAYYNENDPYAAQWLRNLIAAGHIATGDVDERSIADVRGDDLKGYIQCHFFAGIGGWSLACRLAGTPDDEPIWTGSCPCQPFSAAGKQQSEKDSRHLWPEFQRLIAQCAPAVVVGEQVASKLGREWLAGVRADLEDLGYAVGAADLCAASVGAPHIRQRLYWLADAGHDVRSTRSARSQHESGAPKREVVGGGSPHGRLADAGKRQRGRIADGQGRERDRPQTRRQQGNSVAESCGDVGGLAHTERTTIARQRPVGLSLESEQETERPVDTSAWSRWESIGCADGKTRRFEPGIFPLAHGVSGRVGRLRGYGSAIVPQVAAQFLIAAYDSFDEYDDSHV